MLAIFVKGLVLGFSIAAPVGPIGVLCIRRTLAEGRRAGFISGLGATTADFLYGCIAGFGLTLVSDFMLAQQVWFKLIGGAFLLYLGIKTLLSKPAEEAAEAEAKAEGLIGFWFSTFVLTITNPMTILSFVAMFAGLDIATGMDTQFSSLALVVGVAGGSAVWWLLLSFVFSLFRERITPDMLVWVNRISGIIVTGFGLWAVISGILSAYDAANLSVVHQTGAAFFIISNG